MKKTTNEKSIDSRTSIGHIHLKVSDLTKATTFYCDVLGFEISSKIGDSAVFLSAGGYHHHIGLNTWESKGGKAPPLGTTGLYHFAILLPNRKELARVLQRLRHHHWPIDGAADHSVSEAIYLSDPDGNGIEIYADRPRKLWKKTTDGISMPTKPLDFESLLQELNS